MEYYFSKTINDNFENAIQKVTEALKSEGFGILTEIDIKEKTGRGFLQLYDSGCL